MFKRLSLAKDLAKTMPFDVGVIIALTRALGGCRYTVGCADAVALIGCWVSSALSAQACAVSCTSRELVWLQGTVAQQVCTEFNGVETLQMLCDKVREGV